MGFNQHAMAEEWDDHAGLWRNHQCQQHGYNLVAETAMKAVKSCASGAQRANAKYGQRCGSVPGAATTVGSCSDGIGNFPIHDISPVALIDQNGGATLTVPILGGSPAISAADPAAAPSVDQRGFRRPLGSAVDMGACEYAFVELVSPGVTDSGAFRCEVRGEAAETCVIQSSPVDQQCMVAALEHFSASRLLAMRVRRGTPRRCRSAVVVRAAP